MNEDKFVNIIENKVTEKTRKLDEIDFTPDWDTTVFKQGGRLRKISFALTASDTYYRNGRYTDQCEELKDYIVQECNVPENCVELIFNEHCGFDQDPEYELHIYTNNDDERKFKIREQIYYIERKLELIKYLLEADEV